VGAAAQPQQTKEHHMESNMHTYKALMEVRKEHAIGRYFTTMINFEAPYQDKVPASNLYEAAVRAARAQGYETLFVHNVGLAD
jgi:protease II